ncbi:K Homology domain [Theobroma cacao]|nr:K Homology domain [Theobroma cacao]
MVKKCKLLKFILSISWACNLWAYHLHNCVLGSGNQAPVLTSTKVEIVIPQIYLCHVYGESNGNLGHIRQISGANLVIHDPKPGAAEGVVAVSGTSDQLRTAQSLIQAFILCGQTAA